MISVKNYPSAIALYHKDMEAIKLLRTLNESSKLLTMALVLYSRPTLHESLTCPPRDRTPGFLISPKSVKAGASFQRQHTEPPITIFQPAWQTWHELAKLPCSHVTISLT